MFVLGFGFPVFVEVAVAFMRLDRSEFIAAVVWAEVVVFFYSMLHRLLCFVERGKGFV